MPDQNDLSDMSPKDLLYEFERQVDERVAAFQLWRHPLRSILSSIILTADGAFSGGRFGRHRQPNVERGATIISRSSYLLPFMRSASAEIGSDLQNALDVLEPRDFEELGAALAYAHFCEVMPQVRNGYLSVAINEADFVLEHPSREFAEYEACDIIANELSLSAISQPAPFQVPALRQLTADWPRVNPSDLMHVLRCAYEHYLTAVIERELVEPSAYESTFGFDRDDYVKVRAALMAIGRWCVGMAAAAEAESLESPSGEAERWQRECMEWAAPLLNGGYMLGFINALSGCGESNIDRILRFFVDEPLRSGPLISGEGFFAPLIRLGGNFIFSPHAMQIMPGERNILYVSNKQDRQHFNEVVSSHLEPGLLIHAERVFSRFPSMIVRKNIIWERGEIDLLVYNRATNTALQVQAKAPIPPQGARMTRQVEHNTLEAARQLRAFEALDVHNKDVILSASIGDECSNVSWGSAVLVQSSFGTHTAWSALEGIAAINIPILILIVQRMIRHNVDNLLMFPTIADEVIHYVVSRGAVGWTPQQIEVLGRTIKLPLLDLDYQELALIKNEIAPFYRASCPVNDERR